MSLKLTTHDHEDYRVIALSDGTLTQVEIIQRIPSDFGSPKWYRVGLGTAKRRKGDRRNPDLGALLAAERAFRDAADQIKRQLTEQGFVEGVKL